MVVGFAAYDGHGAVELLHEDKAHHLVGERHFRQRQFLLGCGIDIIGETVRTSDDENQTVGEGVHFIGHPIGKFHTSQFASALIEQHDMVAGLKQAQNLLTLQLFLLFLTHFLVVFKLRNDSHVEGQVVLQATDILFSQCRDMRVGRFLDKNQ